jgi:hypothetical protein
MKRGGFSLHFTLIYSTMLPLIALVLTSNLLSAETIPTGKSTPVRISVAGALLGHQEAFCERQDPNAQPLPRGACPEHRTPLGGIDGLAAMLKPERERGAFILLTGNNFPKDINPSGDFYLWDQLAKLNADVIALGQEDLLRAALPVALQASVAKPSAAPGFDPSWLNRLEPGTRNYKFLGTNLSVRHHKTGLNKVSNGGFQLGVSADQSVPWTTSKLSIECPIRDVTSSFSVGIKDGTAITKEPSPCTSQGGFPSAAIKVTLKPNTRYCVTKMGQAGCWFEFTTDLVPTPWDNKDSSTAMQNLPVAIVSKGGARLMVMALLDPAIKSKLGAERWFFGKTTGAEQYELIIASPVDTVRTIFTLAGDESKPSLPVLMSSMDDAATLKVLAASSRWGAVAYYPGSGMLGCSVGQCDKVTDDYADFGRSAVLNQGDRDDHKIAQAWVRPDWQGESLLTVTGETDSDKSFAYFHGDSVKVERQAVPGTLRRRESSGEESIYEPKGKDGSEVSQSILAALLEAIRKARHTEVVIGSLGMVDRDVVSELFEEGTQPDKNSLALTPRDLMDILWRHDAYVTVPMKGSDLLDLVQKLAVAEVDEGSEYCAAGIETAVHGARVPGTATAADKAQSKRRDQPVFCKLPGNIAATEVRVNGRYLDAAMEYSVAMPQSIAQGQKLAGPISHTATDAVEALVQYLAFTSPNRKETKTSSAGATKTFLPEPSQQVPPKEEPTSAKLLDGMLSQRWLGMFYIPPPSIEIGGTKYDVHDGVDASRFSSIPLAGEQVNHTYKFAVAGEVHLIPVDFYALSLDLESKVNVNRVDTFNDANPQLSQRSLSPDDWLNGASLRSRAITNILTDKLASLSRKLNHEAVRIEPYVGFFNESSVFHVHRTFTTTRKAAPTALDQTPQTLFVTEDDRKPNFTFLEASVAFGQMSPWSAVRFKNTSYRFDWGTNHTALSGVDIGGLPFSIADVRNCGLQAILDLKNGCRGQYDLTGLPNRSRIDFTYVNRRENRQQLLTTLELSRSPSSKNKLTVDFAGKLWMLKHSESTLLEPLWSTEFNIKYTMQLPYGISAGPYLRYYRVKAFGEPGAFSSERYGFTVSIPVYSKLGISRFLY